MFEKSRFDIKVETLCKQWKGLIPAITGIGIGSVLQQLDKQQIAIPVTVWTPSRHHFECKRRIHPEVCIRISA